MADVRELGQKVKAKYPGAYNDIDDAELGRRVKAKYPGAYDDFTDAPAQPQTPQESAYERFRRNVGVEGQRFFRKVGDTAEAAGEIVSSAFQGDFRPAREAVELAGRAAAPIVAALGGRPELAGQTYLAGSVQQAAPIAEVNAQRTARRDAGDNADYWRRSREDIARLDAEAAKDPSLSGKITRGVVGVGAEALTALLAGGSSVPGVIASGAALELNSPENIPLVVLGGAIPGGAKGLRSAAPAIERTLGKGAAQIVEAEAAGTAGGLIRATGAAADEAAIRAASLPSTALNTAVAEGVEEIPRSIVQRAGAEVAALYNVPRALVASMDVSAPLRQGALLTLPPSQWGRAASAGLKMFESFSTKRYQRIVEEIAQHPDAQIAQRAGLHLSTQVKSGLKKSEEDFVSKYAGRIPGVKHSQQAYESYLDNLRLSTFSKYKALIDKRNISAAEKENAYQAAARWLNTASGRGSLGEKLDKAMDAANAVLFAPRFLASRINVLDPRTYTRNLSTEGGRVVLRQQMQGLMEAAGVLASTVLLAKAAGATVSLSPSSPDFLKVKFGNRRFDLLAGEQQVMRLIYRVGAAVTRSAQGEKSKPGEGALDVAGRFLRSKLAPVPSFFVDFLTRKTYDGRDFDAAKGAAERVAPLVWQDFLEAYQKEGFGGVAATTPALFGVGVQFYDDSNSLLNRAAPLFRAYVEAERGIPEIRRAQNESDEAFNARVKVFGEALERYGMGLIDSQEFKQANAKQKRKMLDLLPRRISSALMKQGEAWMLAPRVIADDVRESMELKK